MNTSFKYLPLACLLLLGCGGSGAPDIDRSAPITSLTEQQRQDFCAWEASALGGEGKQYDCNGAKLTVKATSECVSALRSAPASCSNITYGEVKDCTDQQVQNVCTGLGSAACQRFSTDAAACSMHASTTLTN
jgi:hypothetical protein